MEQMVRDLIDACLALGRIADALEFFVEREKEKDRLADETAKAPSSIHVNEPSRF